MSNELYIIIAKYVRMSYGIDWQQEVSLMRLSTAKEVDAEHLKKKQVL